MHVIQTHEQADFDALASLLGAYLLNDHSLPVLPRRMNRNAQAFVTLYGAELPFIDLRDLPLEPVETISLVDTQSLVTIKGVSQHTHVHTIDHHPLREGLPENWTVSIDRVGACTTLFVETLRDENESLSTIQASLLLLGIYEDTGSLTYISTHARDVRAAAYLLEQGASLRILGNFLNPPLSPDQRTLYDQLLASAQTLTIHGQKIVITHTHGEEMVEEISTVAHKLRDLLDPEALFLVVHTKEGIRMVARSTSDQINVARVTAQFDGGGHDRAAGALIHPERLEPLQLPSGEILHEPLEIVCQKLIDLLPRFVKPAITVSRLMSKRPRVISPTTTAQEAAQLMQRYGYEGYPVVSGGKVMGLLTRRAVDRAIAHKLNLTAGSLMEAGEVTVHPSDSIEHLQHLMVTTGWGQIPVADPETGEIMGIVTRTDLLKMLAGGETLLPERQNLGQRLDVALPPARLALLKTIADQAYAQHLAIYLVGGFVRDLLLDRAGLDFDIVVEGDAIHLARTLSERFGGRVVGHARFGTAKWWIAEIHSQLVEQLKGKTKLDPRDLPESIDLISARTEFYDHPTALPTIERSGIKLDLHRRDFTINTMALRLDGRHYGELYDYWGGLLDLNRGLVRVLHSLSFVDDPTRMLRAVRFEQRFHFQIEARTLELISEASPLLRQLSGQRLRHELDLILAEEKPGAVLARLQELGLLEQIHPALCWDLECESVLHAARKAPIPQAWHISAPGDSITIQQMLGYLIWLAPKEPEFLEQLAERLRFNHHLHDVLIATNLLLRRLPEMVNARPSEVVELLEGKPKISLFAVYLVKSSRDVCRLIENYINKWQNIQPFIDGNVLQKRMIKPGPIYHQILITLRNAWLDGLINDEAGEQALLEQLLANLPAETV